MILRKVKGIAVGAGIALIGGAAAYASGVDWTGAFGPTAGLIIATLIGYVVKEYKEPAQKYVDSLDD